MSNTARAFARAQEAGSKAFIPYIPCGDPDLETTTAIVEACAHAGADLIELGIPFSDPIAEGPVIQEASARALAGGVTTDKIFDMVRDLRTRIDTPLAFMTYANVVYSYGVDRFLTTASAAGIDALILPDVPFEEKNEFAPNCRKVDIDFVSLIAPTSHDRITAIAKEAEGFIYCVSSMGVTGVRKEITTDVGAMVDLVRAATDTPVAIGFGISTPEQARDMAAVSDGVIVGSAIVRIIAEHGRTCVPAIKDYVRAMKAAIS
ncbi:MAG: tryptophan synthase subunit alpha [Actinomycetaceae bacterium]|nr:tryptophan synthase subunit alpha [Actinomycetaceae bacterium]